MGDQQVALQLVIALPLCLKLGFGEGAGDGRSELVFPCRQVLRQDDCEVNSLVSASRHGHPGRFLLRSPFGREGELCLHRDVGVGVVAQGQAQAKPPRQRVHLLGDLKCRGDRTAYHEPVPGSVGPFLPGECVLYGEVDVSGRFDFCTCRKRDGEGLRRGHYGLDLHPAGGRVLGGDLTSLWARSSDAPALDRPRRTVAQSGCQRHLSAGGGKARAEREQLYRWLGVVRRRRTRAGQLYGDEVVDIDAGDGDGDEAPALTADYLVWQCPLLGSEVRREQQDLLRRSAVGQGDLQWEVSVRGDDAGRLDVVVDHVAEENVAVGAAHEVELDHVRALERGGEGSICSPIERRGELADALDSLLGERPATGNRQPQRGQPGEAAGTVFRSHRILREVPPVFKAEHVGEGGGRALFVVLVTRRDRAEEHEPMAVMDPALEESNLLVGKQLCARQDKRVIFGQPLLGQVLLQDDLVGDVLVAQIAGDGQGTGRETGACLADGGEDGDIGAGASRSQIRPHAVEEIGIGDDGLADVVMCV